MALARISDKDFQIKIQKDAYVLVVFSSSSCGYCQIAKNNLQQILKQLPELKVYECLIEESPQSTATYQISSVPIFKFFLKGEVVYTGFGVRTPMDLYYQLKGFLPQQKEYYWPEE